MNSVISKDGTKIYYQKSGKGKAVILVSSAAADHSDANNLAEHLAKYFTVYNYDRRGRGNSSDTLPYKVKREIEDIEALIEAAGGSPCLFGSSAGAVLALEAANQLGNKVSKLFLYEPPFIINDSRPPVPSDYVQHVTALVEMDQRCEAVEYYMTQAVGVPSEYLAYMKADPSWEVMQRMAHTLAYDGLIMEGTQTGQALPVERWHVSIPTCVMVGENSEDFFHDAAKSLVHLLPNAKYRSLAGQDHSAILMAPAILGSVIVDFLHS
jgi:pimeloyl-ACP methyl ester carboxylesterase